MLNKEASHIKVCYNKIYIFRFTSLTRELKQVNKSSKSWWTFIRLLLICIVGIFEGFSGRCRAPVADKICSPVTNSTPPMLLTISNLSNSTHANLINLCANWRMVSSIFTNTSLTLLCDMPPLPVTHLTHRSLYLHLLHQVSK